MVDLRAELASFFPALHMSRMTLLKPKAACLGSIYGNLWSSPPNVLNAPGHPVPVGLFSARCVNPTRSALACALLNIGQHLVQLRGRAYYLFVIRRNL